VSVPQMPTWLIRTRTWPSLQIGFDIFVIETLLGVVNTAAFIL